MSYHYSGFKSLRPGSAVPSDTTETLLQLIQVKWRFKEKALKEAFKPQVHMGETRKVRRNLPSALKRNHFCSRDSCWLVFKETELLQTPNSPQSGTAVFLPLSSISFPFSPTTTLFFPFHFIYDIFHCALSFSLLAYFFPRPFLTFTLF